MRYSILLLLLCFFFIGAYPAVSALVLIAGLAFLTYKMIKYYRSAYYQVTKRNVLSVFFSKGFWGEYQTYRKLQHYETDGARFLFNVYVPKEYDETTEIDVLMIAHNGLFVFESKNFSGWIYGNERQKYWTQVLAGGHEKNRFYNPIWQNAGHIKYLYSYIEKEVPSFSMIVFSNRCKLKQIDIFSPQYFVVHRNDINMTVEHVLQNTKSVLTDTEIAALYNKLLPFSQVRDDIKQNHIALIKREKSASVVQPVREVSYAHTAPLEVEDANGSLGDSQPKPLQPCCAENFLHDPELLKCPRCGGTLILRTAKRGDRAGKQFYGCSNYPRCRYIQNIE